MRSNLTSISKAFLIVAILALMVPVASALAAEYTVGVKVGDWIEYDVDSSWSDPETEPSGFRYEWVKLEIQSLDGTEVTVLATIRYRDGTEETNTISWDLERGGAEPWPWIIPADLTAGDPIAVGSDMIIDETVTRTYIGASRKVNLLDMSQSYEDTTSTWSFYWDQPTGVLLELLVNISSPTGTGMLTYEVIGTDVWGPVPLQVIAQLSSETVTQGDDVMILATVKDEAENPIEGATVSATIGDLEALILFSEQGNGNYQAEIDTSVVGGGAHEVVVNAEKKGYESSLTSVILSVETLRMQMAIHVSERTVKRGDSVRVSADITDLAGNPVEGATVTVYIDEKAVDLIDEGDGEYQVDVDTSDVEEGTYTLIVSARKEGCEDAIADVPEALTVETRILQVTMQLSADTATQGDVITVSATVKDTAEEPIEGATVSATLEHKTVVLSDQGNGDYEGNIDTFDISEGTHLVTVTAEKELCEPAENTESLNVRAAVPWALYIGIAAIVIIVIAAVIIYRIRK